MSLTSYRAAPPRGCFVIVKRDVLDAVYGSGGDLLSHGLSRSTIGAAGLNGRVREGIGCFPRAVTARPVNRIQRRVWGRAECPMDVSARPLGSTM